MLAWINDVDGFVAALEAVLNERQQHAILFLITVEKRAHMTDISELGAGERNRGCGALHVRSSPHNLPRR